MSAILKLMTSSECLISHRGRSPISLQVEAHGDPRGASTASPGEPQYPRKSLSYSAHVARIQIRQLLLVIKPVFERASAQDQMKCYVNGLLYVKNEEQV